MDINLDINVTTLVIQIVATLLLFGVVGIFFAKPMKKFLEKRREFINEEFVNARLVNDEAALLKEQAGLELKKIKAEARQMLEASNAKARVKSESIVADARIEAELEIDKARKLIAKERNEMYHEAKKEIAQLATNVTSKLVKKEMDQAVHDDLFDEFVKLVGGADDE